MPEEPPVRDPSAGSAMPGDGAPGRPRRCFVISPIGDEGSAIREHADDVLTFIIEPALRECGVEAVRSDHLMEPGRISDQMFRELFNDDFCIALITGRNPNVYYELALAQASGRPVIVLLSRDEELPFDIQDMRTVRYDLKPRPLFDGVYADEIVAHVRALAQSGWRVESAFRDFGFEGSGDDTLTFLEHAAKGVPPERWAAMLTEAEQAFDVMGLSLHAWPRTDEVAAKFREKARAGVRVRVMLLSPDNPALPYLFSAGLGDRTLETVVRDIAVSRAYFEDVAREVPGMVVRSIEHGLPYSQFTRADEIGLFIPYLNSEPTAYSPVWRCRRGSLVYRALVQEFEAVWRANDGAPGTSSG